MRFFLYKWRLVDRHFSARRSNEIGLLHPTGRKPWHCSRQFSYLQIRSAVLYFIIHQLISIQREWGCNQHSTTSRERWSLPKGSNYRPLCEALVVAENQEAVQYLLLTLPVTSHKKKYIFEIFRTLKLKIRKTLLQI